MIDRVKRQQALVSAANAATGHIVRAALGANVSLDTIRVRDMVLANLEAACDRQAAGEWSKSSEKQISR